MRKETWQRQSQRRFEDLAKDPEAWRDNARNLRRAAALLWDRMKAEDPSAMIDWVFAGRIAVMLEGLAVENLAKGLHVKKAPEIVKDGTWRLTGSRGHDIVYILAGAGFTLDTAEKHLVARLQAYVSWAGRYPIAKSHEDTAPTITDAGYELAPGTYFSTQDRDRVRALFSRMEEALAQ